MQIDKQMLALNSGALLQAARVNCIVRQVRYLDLKALFMDQICTFVSETWEIRDIRAVVKRHRPINANFQPNITILQLISVYCYKIEHAAHIDPCACVEKLWCFYRDFLFNHQTPMNSFSLYSSFSCRYLTLDYSTVFFLSMPYFH